MWHFSDSDLDGRNLKDPSEYTTQSRELTQLQIFVREVLQNSLDNRLNDNQVSVNFRVNHVSGELKTKIADSLELKKVIPHYQAVIQDGKIKLPDPLKIYEEQNNLKLLYIDDYGTRGLIGPEYDREKERFPGIPHCFLGLCRIVGDSQKGTQTLGGTYGFGKTVLWKNSRVRMVMFYSRMASPYQKSGEQTNYYNRFFGQIRLPGHYVDEGAFRGEAYFGLRKEKLTWSLFDEEADKYATLLEIPLRTGNEFGTSILIVDFDDPDINDDDEDPNNTAQNIKEAAEKYFWPAIMDSRLVVKIGVGGYSNIQMSVANPKSQYNITPYIQAYDRAKNNIIQNDFHASQHEVKIPKGPGTEKETIAQLKIATQLQKTNGNGNDESLINKVALIRGAGMVVGYMPIVRQGLGGTDYYSIVLGGNAFQNNVDIKSQQRMEKLLSFAEPVTHDAWTYNSENLKDWRGSTTAIKTILNTIKKAISDITIERIVPEGNAGPLLSAMFPIYKGSDGEKDPRNIHLEFVKNPSPIDTKDGSIRYNFEIRLKVPPKAGFAGKIKPDNWRIICRYGFFGEGTKRKIVDYAKLKLIQVRAEGETWTDIPSSAPDIEAVYEAPILMKQMTYEFKGETEQLDAFLAVSTKHDLEIKIDHGMKQEESK